MASVEVLPPLKQAADDVAMQVRVVHGRSRSGFGSGWAFAWEPIQQDKGIGQLPGFVKQGCAWLQHGHA